MSYSCLKCDNEVDGETCPRVNSSIDDEGFYKSHCLCELCYMKVINFIVGHEHFSITPKLVIADKSMGKVEADVDPDDAMIATATFCPDCGELQFRCDSGIVCKNGHGY